jgi:hypothetical protein
VRRFEVDGPERNVEVPEGSKVSLAATPTVDLLSSIGTQLEDGERPHRPALQSFERELAF